MSPRLSRFLRCTDRLMFAFWIRCDRWRRHIIFCRLADQSDHASVQYVCTTTTADIWSAHNHSFLNTTVHWIDEGTLRQKSVHTLHWCNRWRWQQVWYGQQQGQHTGSWWRCCAVPPKSIARHQLIATLESVPAESVTRRETITSPESVQPKSVARPESIATLESVPAESVARRETITNPESVPPKSIARPESIATLESVPAESVARREIITSPESVPPKSVARPESTATLLSVQGDWTGSRKPLSCIGKRKSIKAKKCGVCMAHGRKTQRVRL